MASDSIMFIDELESNNQGDSGIFSDNKLKKRLKETISDLKPCISQKEHIEKNPQQ